MVLEIESVEQFDQILLDSQNEKEEEYVKHGKKYVIVDFFAVWCRPCMMFAPTYEELSEKYGDVYFLKVNIDDVPDLGARYEIRSLPTFMLFDVGSLESGYERIIGANRETIEQKLDYFSKKNKDDSNPEAVDF